MRLSPKQVACLAEIAKGPRSAYPKLSLGTLNSLALKELVAAERKHGSFYSPRTAITWSITEAGREALAANNK